MKNMLNEITHYCKVPGMYNSLQNQDLPNVSRLREGEQGPIVLHVLKRRSSEETKEEYLFTRDLEVASSGTPKSGIL